MNSVKRITLFVLVFFHYFLSAQLISLEKIYEFNKNEIKEIWIQNKIPSLITPINYEVNVYKVVYLTKWIDQNPIKASGLYYAPISKDKTSTLIYNHGTRINKKISTKIKGENIISMIFAADGYAVIAPDYIGLGEGEKEHLYCNVESEALAAIDFLNVVDQINSEIGLKRNEKLFITGYSQGGHASMSTHMVLERDYTNKHIVTASSPMSGPYDIHGVQSSVMYSSYEQPHYLPYLLIGLNRAYKIWPEEDFFNIFKSPYDTIIPQLFNGEHNIKKINQALPLIPVDMLNKSLLDEYAVNSDFILHKYIKMNNIFDWTPRAPIQLCYCKGDKEVLYENAILAHKKMTENGALDIRLKSSGNKFSHQKCAGYTTIYTKFYFDSFRKEHKRIRKGPLLQRIALTMKKSFSKD